MNRGLLLLLSIFFIIKIQAQEGKPDLFGVSYGSDKIKNDSVKGKIKDVDAFLNFPIYRDNEEAVGGRLQFKSRSISGLDPAFSKDLYGTDFFVFWQVKIKQKYKLYFFAQVGAYSDFKDISEEDFRYSFGARYTIQHNDNLKTGW